MKDVAHLLSPHCVPWQGLAQVCQSFSKPVGLQIRHTQTPVAWMLTADLSQDHRPPPSRKQFGEGLLQHQPMSLRQSKCRQAVKDQVKMYTAHTSSLPFKDKRLQSQVPTRASALACTSDQFCSSKRLCPNYTPRMWTGLSLQWKGPDRGTPPLQAPCCRLSLFSKLFLASAICSYFATAFFMAFMSKWRDTKTVILSVYTETFAVRRPAIGDTIQGWICPLSLSLHQPVGCGTSCWSIGRTSVVIRQSPKQLAKTDGQPYERSWTDPNWSAWLQCRLLFPLGPCTPSACCLGLIFSSQHSSAQVWSDR